MFDFLGDGRLWLLRHSVCIYMPEKKFAPVSEVSQLNDLVMVHQN